MKKEYILLLLLLLGPSLGAVAQQPMTLGVSDSVVCNGGSVTLQVSQTLVTENYYYTLMCATDTTATGVSSLVVDSTVSPVFLLTGQSTPGTFFYWVVLTDTTNPGAQVEYRSDTLQVVVLAPFTVGRIASDVDTVCHGQMGDTIRFVEQPDGYHGALSYSWTRTALGSQTGILSGTDTFYVTGTEMRSLVGVEGYAYRVEVHSLCGNRWTDYDTIILRASLEPGIILSPVAICAGSIPADLTLSRQFSGGDNVFSYQWQDSTASDTVWNDILGADSTVCHYVTPLYDSVWYRLRAYNALCDTTLMTAPKLLRVYDTLTAPHIALLEEDTVCYGTQLVDPLTVDTLSSGSIGFYTYEWEQLIDGDSVWTTIPASNITSYAPDTLFVTASYRVKVTSGVCGSRYSSNTVTVNVLPQAVAGSIVPVDTTLCFHSSLVLSLDTMPAGADGNFGFLWQMSADSVHFDSIPTSQQGDVQYEAFFDSSMFYRVLVTNERCQLSLPTNIVRVGVYDSLTVNPVNYSFFGTDTIGVTCYGHAPDFSFVSSTPIATGGSGRYGYLWQSSTDDSVYVAARGDNTDGYAYVPPVLYEDVWFRLMVSDSLCGHSVSNSLPIQVFDLPEVPVLGGDTAHLCASSNFVRYWVAPDTNMNYRWSSVYADVIDHADSSVAYVRWSSLLDTVSLTLDVTEKVHGCTRSVTFDSIHIDTVNHAPDTTTVVIKRGAGILICKEDSTAAHYQWGFTHRATGVDTLFADSDIRYYRLPDILDTVGRDYFVIVWYAATPMCQTRSYLVSSADVAPASGKAIHLTVAPNPSLGEVYYMLDDDIEGPYTLSVYDAVGQILFSQDCDNYVRNIPVRLGRQLRQGIYVVAVTTNDRVVSQKIIVK